MTDKPRVRVIAGDTTGVSGRLMSGAADSLNPYGRVRGMIGQPFEAAGQGRRLRGFNPARTHINRAIQAAGPTLVARARWLYENNGYAGNIVDEWVSASVGDGIKPRPKKGTKAQRVALMDLWWDWTDEADADGQTDFYGLQEKVARECFLAGECFVRMRQRRAGDMMTVPFQLQILPSEMLDPSFDLDNGDGSYIRAGIEFNAIGKRTAYHFFRQHPYDAQRFSSYGASERVRVPAEDVIHVFEGRQGGQIRGVPRIARVLVKLFALEMYDDAELERKKTSALFAAFLIGRGDVPFAPVNDDVPGADDDSAVFTVPPPIPGIEPGAFIDLGDDKDIKFSTPADVGGNYDAFQYRQLTNICAGAGVPYAYGSGDVAKGNFSNVRTDIIRFRRRISQWVNNTLIFQLCRPVWRRFVDLAVLDDQISAPNHAVRPRDLWASEWLPPRQEWIDPAKDVKAELEAIDGGLKSRTQSVAERGYDREELDEEIASERAAAAAFSPPLVFKSDSGAMAEAVKVEPTEDDAADGEKIKEGADNEA